MPTQPLESRIATWVLEAFGLELRALEPIAGGLDPEATVLRAAGLDGREWAVKRSRRDNRFGLLLAQSLGLAGVLGVPEQLITAEGLPWSEREGDRLSISAWVDGREAFDRGLTAEEWEALGTLLKRVHDAEPPSIPGARASRSDESGPPARRGIRRAGMRVSKRLARIDRLVATARFAETDDPALSRLVFAWPEIRGRVVALRRAAARLKRDRTPTERVSCHGDPHLGNVLVDASGQPWLIDFDDAVRAPREVDLMLIELGVLFTVPITDEDRRAFHAGYGAVPLDQDRILRFGCVRAIEDLLVATEDLLLRHPERLPSDLETLINGVLSDTGLAGLVEARLTRI